MEGSRIALVLLGCVAASFFAMGAAALRRPDQVVRLFGTPELTKDGRNEVRAVYGGYGLAMALVLLATLWFPTLRLGVLLTVSMALLGMAVGRLVSAIVDGSPSRIPWFFFFVETFLASLLLFVLDNF